MVTAFSKALSPINGVTVLQFTQGVIQSTGTLKTNPPAGNIVPPGPLETRVATDSESVRLNLDAAAATGDTFSTSSTAYDSLGASHVVTFAFTKSPAANQWTYAMSLPTGDLTAAGTPSTGTLTVDPNGNISRPGGNPAPASPQVQPMDAPPKMGNRCKGTAPAFSAAERERLILEHIPQVRLVARRIHERLPGSVSLDDLISTGAVGLIAAIDCFDPTLNVKLKTYAEYKIRGAILDSLRGLDWAPRQQRKRSKQIDAAIAVVEQRLYRSPLEEEIAAHLGVTIEAYHRWLVELQGLNVGSLEAATSDDEGSRDLLNFISDDKESWPSSLMERSELQRLLAETIGKMPDMEKTVLSLYYYEELTLREISKIVNLHESRISQLKSQAILRLRAYMEKRWPCTRGV
jgi:RNA polymerase sigma factor for flagellar operon FliA